DVMVVSGSLRLERVSQEAANATLGNAFRNARPDAATTNRIRKRLFISHPPQENLRTPMVAENLVFDPDVISWILHRRSGLSKMPATPAYFGHLSASIKAG